MTDSTPFPPNSQDLDLKMWRACDRLFLQAYTAAKGPLVARHRINDGIAELAKAMWVRQ